MLRLQHKLALVCEIPAKQLQTLTGHNPGSFHNHPFLHPDFIRHILSTPCISSGTPPLIVYSVHIPSTHPVFDGQILPTSEITMILPKDPTLPTLVSWNLQIAQPTNMTRINERLEQHDIKAWLLQDWKAVRRNDDSMPWAVSEGQCLFCGPKTAILLMDPSWEIVTAAVYSNYASKITIKIPSTSESWTIISAYLPSDHTRHLEFLRQSMSLSDLLLSDISWHDLA